MQRDVSESATVGCVSNQAGPGVGFNEEGGGLSLPLPRSLAASKTTDTCRHWLWSTILRLHCNNSTISQHEKRRSPAVGYEHSIRFPGTNSTVQGSDGGPSSYPRTLQLGYTRLP